MPLISAARVFALVALLFGLACLAGCASSEPDATRAADQALTEQCPSGVEEGIDVFDGQGAIDWRAVAASGVRFAIIKATQGTYDTQATFAADWSGARSAGIARGAYHFFDPTEDGAAQAAHFLAVVGPMEADDVAPVLDIECPDGDDSCLYDGAPGVAPPADIHDRMWDFLRAVASATGRVPMLYTFGSYFASNGVDVTGLDAFPLFLAYPTDASCLGVPAPWSAAALWQYSWAGTVSGIGAAVDRDRWLGPSLFATSTASAPGSASTTATATLNATDRASAARATTSSTTSWAVSTSTSRPPLRSASMPAWSGGVSGGCSLSPGRDAPPWASAWMLASVGLALMRRRLP